MPLVNRDNSKERKEDKKYKKIIIGIAIASLIIAVVSIAR